MAGSLIGGAIGAVGSIIGGSNAAGAASSAAGAQLAATQAGIEFQEQALEQIRGDLDPFRQAGIFALYGGDFPGYGSGGGNGGGNTGGTSTGGGSGTVTGTANATTIGGQGFTNYFTFGESGQPGLSFEEFTALPDDVRGDYRADTTQGFFEPRYITDFEAKLISGDGIRDQTTGEILPEFQPYFWPNGQRRQDVIPTADGSVNISGNVQGQGGNGGQGGGNNANQMRRNNPLGGIGLLDLVTNPLAQKSFIENNPFFDALAGEAKTEVKNLRAARGKLNSGGTAEALQNSLLLLGNNLLAQNIQQRQNIATMGQNAAAQTGTATLQSASQISDLTTQGGNAIAAGQIGSANAFNQGIQGAISAIQPAIGGLTASTGLTGGYDPSTGITWTGPRVA